MSDERLQDSEIEGAQKELPLEETELPLLRVSPGMAVSSEHLDKLGGNEVIIVDGIGPMEVWASYGLVYRDRIEGRFSKKRVGWDEARRLQELVREVGWDESRLDSRQTIEDICSMPNGDILSAAEALAEVNVESRAMIHQRCSEVVEAHSGPLSLVSAVGAAAQVRNDDIRTPREVIEMTLWLLSRAQKSPDDELLAWLLGHEEEAHGLTGLVAACDDFYKEITGSRPSSTLQSRTDRCAALRFRMAVTDSTPVTPALTGEYESNEGAEEGDGPKEGETGADDMGTTLVDIPRVPEESVELGEATEEPSEPSVSDTEVGQPSIPGIEPIAAEAAPVKEIATTEDRLGQIERQLRKLDERMNAMADSPAHFGENPGGTSGVSLSVVAILVGLSCLLSVGLSSWLGQAGTAVEAGSEQLAPRVSEDFAKANFPGTDGSDATSAAGEGDGELEPTDDNVASGGINEQPKAGDAEPETVNPVEKQPEVDNDKGVLAETGTAPEVKEQEPELESADKVEEPPSLIEKEESSKEPEQVAEPVAEPVAEVKAAEEGNGEDVAGDTPDVETPAAKKGERVAERYGLGFKATHRLTKRTKLFRYGTRDFVEVTDLPGGDALVDECIVARAPRSRFRHKIYKGYQSIYLSCAGEMKVICEKLGCEPQQRCITAAGWVKKCK